MGQQPIVLSDCRIKMKDNTAKKYPEELRLVKAVVLVNGNPYEMQFITNNLDWSAYSICDLYLAPMRDYLSSHFLKKLKEF